MRTQNQRLVRDHSPPFLSAAIRRQQLSMLRIKTLHMNAIFQKISLAIFFSVFCLASCKKEKEPVVNCNEKTNTLESVRRLIVGNYQWAYTKVTNQTGSFEETPANTGLNYRYEFKKDGKVDYYENSNLKSTNLYTIDYEFKVTTFPSDSATVIIINDTQSGQRKEFFRAYLCNDSALFYNPYNSIDYRRFFSRN